HNPHSYIAPATNAIPEAPFMEMLLAVAITEGKLLFRDCLRVNARVSAQSAIPLLSFPSSFAPFAPSW
ncbi:MAG: hypothetical protein ABSH19_09555, partial [Opitutales bacterium]